MPGPQPHHPALLVEYFEIYLRDHDLDAFRQRIIARYTEGTLARLLEAGDLSCRRAAVLALGLIGTFDVNPVVARALKDTDPTVRNLAENALWTIWFRADSPENNVILEQISDLNKRQRYHQAIEMANRLIARAPGFAEAHNQRAIAHFFLDRLEESIADCERVLAHNPYHTGALSGMGQAYLRLNLKNKALECFRRASVLQPYNEGLKAAIAELEAQQS